MGYVAKKRTQGICEIVYIVNGTVTPLVSLLFLVNGYLKPAIWILSAALVLTASAYLVYSLVELIDKWKVRKTARKISRTIRKMDDKDIGGGFGTDFGV